MPRQARQTVQVRNLDLLLVAFQYLARTSRIIAGYQTAHSEFIVLALTDAPHTALEIALGGIVVEVRVAQLAQIIL